MILQPQSFSKFSQFPELLQVSSTRLGGFSSGSYAGLNLGMHCGDQKSIVKRNRQLYFEYLNIAQENLVFPAQIHSGNVRLVEAAGTVADCDALITGEINLFLTIQTADCFPVFLFDPHAKAIGIVHSGWRGTAKNIVGKTIRLMQEKLQASACDMIAGIGVGVQQNCYQVDELTASNFDPKYLMADGPGHFKLDVQGRIREQLREAGIKPENIEWDETCSHCAEDLYYSYRRNGQESGRMMGVIGLRQ